MANKPNLAPGAVLIDVLPQHAFDEERLWVYLAAHLDGFTAPATLKQFQGGQSNPTFLITTPKRKFVLRKKPPGALLPSAHLIEREFRVLKALENSAVPVPRVHLLCEDVSVIGTSFFVMAHVAGRLMKRSDLPELELRERCTLYDDMIRVLAAIHSIDWKAVGLEGFGKPEKYVARQVERWTRQYLASKTDQDAAMDQLIVWLQANIPTEDETALAHGDYRLGNLLVHPSEPRVVAVLDWELSTLGHPLGDLAYACMFYRFPPDEPVLPGLAGCDVRALGIPTEAQFIGEYCRLTARAEAPAWLFFLAFSFFRSAAICQGVYARGLQGNAADRRAIEHGRLARMAAQIGWSVAREAA